MPGLKRGDVVLTPFPFTDLSGAPLRPALIVSQGPIGQDVVLAAISSVVRGQAIPTDLMVETTHPEFGQTGLRVASVIRRLGSIGSQLQAEVDRLLRHVLGL